MATARAYVTNARYSEIGVPTYRFTVEIGGHDRAREWATSVLPGDHVTITTDQPEADGVVGRAYVQVEPDFSNFAISIADSLAEASEKLRSGIDRKD